MRSLINENLTTLRNLDKSILSLESQIEDTVELTAAAEEALIIMQTAAKMSQEHLAAHLSGIVTKAIQAVIEKPYEFVCEFIERRGSTEADLYLMKEGKQFGILDGTGGGLADVCSFALKVAYLLLSNVDRVLIIDEVSRHINSPEQRRNFAQVLATLSKELGIQMIINSTIPELHEVADKIITLEQVNEVTRIANQSE